MKKNLNSRKMKVSQRKRIIASFLTILFLNQICFQTVAMAISGGAVQQEYMGFEQAGASDLVNLYTGDLKYNLPLLSVPGIGGSEPISLSYSSSDVNMDAEASWVGLGWTLNAGATVRGMQGIPDDYKNQEIEYDYDFKEAKNFSIGLKGLDNLISPKGKTGKGQKVTGNAKENPSNHQLTIYDNSYSGLGFTYSHSSNRGFTWTYDSQTGIDIQLPTIELNKKMSKTKIALQAGYHNRTGKLSTAIKFSKQSADYNGQGQGNQWFSGTVYLTGYNFETTPLSTPTVTEGTNFPLILSTKVDIGKHKYDLLWFDINDSKTNPVLKEKRNGYGVMYDNSYSSNKDVRDVSRVDKKYTRRAKMISPAVATNDIFSYTSNGAMGAFRVNSSNVKLYHTPTVQSKGRIHNIPTDLGLDLKESGAFAAVATVGYYQTRSKSFSGAWKDQGNYQFPITQSNKDIWSSNNYRVAEDFYLKDLGDLTLTEKGDGSENMFSLWGGEDPVRVQMHAVRFGVKPYYKATDQLKNAKGKDVDADIIDPSSNYFKTKMSRDKRQTSVTHLTIAKSQAYGAGTYLKYYENGIYKSFYEGTSYNDDLIGEIDVLQTDGSKVVYAMPVFTTSKNDAFSVGDGDTNDETGIFGLANGSNNNLLLANESALEYKDDNNMNVRNSVHLKEKYASAWLLSQRTSSDYVDLLLDGPTDDDFGGWIKYEYEKKVEAVAEVKKPFIWRTPYTGGYFSEGKKGIEWDDMASYNGGTRDQVYLKKIETKTHIAIFEISARADGKGANDLDKGGWGTNSASSYRLDKIKLYVKSVYLANPTTAIPLETVHFEYNYSLCPGTHNSVAGNQGKLTLKSVKFSSQNSTRGLLQSYDFEYSQNNPVYELKNMDRWGHYQNNTQYGTGNEAFSYADMPYTNQRENQSTADAWLLKAVNLPSGGRMEFEYERDDYAYVENKKAMEMFDIRGIGWGTQFNGTLNIGNHGREENFSTGKKVSLPHDDMDDSQIYFELKSPIPPGANVKQYIINNYIKGMTKVYFKVLIDLAEELKVPSDVNKRKAQMEYVEGVAELNLESIGLSSTNSNFAYVTLKHVDLTAFPNNVSNSLAGIGVQIPKIESVTKIHPFMKRAFQSLRLNRNDVMFNSGNGRRKLTDINGLESLWNDIKVLFTGFNTAARNVKMGSKIYLNGNSAIRLFNPEGKKYGGDVRVKSVSLKDNWVNTSTADSYTYKQIYDYTIEEADPNNSTLKRTISSGVCYEPMNGIEESSIFELEPYYESKFPFAESEFFTTKPYLLNLYPPAGVGYRKVTVKTKYPNDVDVSSTSSPNISYGFYTAKEYPVIEKITGLNETVFPLQRSMSYYNKTVEQSYHLMGKSQGFSIIKNDMAGKMRFVEERTQGGEFISRTEYFFKTEGGFNENNLNNLNNTVSTINENGQIVQKTLGLDFDVFVDQHEEYSKTSNTIGGEIGAYIFSIQPFVQPTFQKYLKTSYGVTSFKTLTVNKVVYKRGLLEKVRTIQDEAEIDTEFLLYDSETGDPLLTKSTNEFKDPIYKQDIPGHWKYPQMGGAYKNIGVTLKSLSIQANNKVTYSGANQYLQEGDVVRLKKTILLNTSYYHATVENLTANEFSLVYYGDDIEDNVVGNSGKTITPSLLSGSFDLQVIQSGYKNLLGITVGGVVSQNCTSCLGNPSSGTYSLDITKVIDASATIYGDEWEYSCDCAPSTGNQYLLGRKGIWRPYQSYVINVNRVVTTDKNGIRNEGHMIAYQAFNWDNPSQSNIWTLAQQINRYSTNGSALEVENALGLNSGAIFGYNNVFSTAVAENSKTSNMGFDGFEDHDQSNCEVNKNFTFKNASGLNSTSISSTESHTGKKSLKVAPLKKVKLNQTLKTCQ